MPGHSSNVTPFTLDLLTNTDWANLADDIIGALFPNFFIIYFGQDFPQGGISSDNIKVKFAKLGTGYNLLVSAATDAIDKKDDICKVIGAASELTNYSRTDFPKSHFFSSYNSAKSFLLHPDHTASSLSLIQTSTQLRQTSYVKFLSQL
jgi:hypothetical protein